jgi:hypothetical protein
MDQEALLREAAEDTLRREADARRFLYSDVEEMIQRGFLTQHFMVEGVPVVLRTLNPREVSDLLLRSVQSNEINWMRHHIAASVYMINGYAIEPQYASNQAWYVYNEWVKDLHYEQVLVVYAYITGLRNRVGRATRIVDAFCHERYSRSLWRMSGTPVGERNIIQRLWAAYNESEDRYDADIRQWQHTRSVVGSMSGKGAKSLLEAENKWEEKRQRRAQRTIEDAVNWLISGEKEDQKPLLVTVNGQTYEVPKVHAAQTIEEMESEMMRAVRGEKDYHDLLVEQYKEGHRRRLEEARQKQQAALAAAWGDDEGGLRGETRMVGYTPEQLAEINPDMLKKKPNTQRAAVSPEQERFTEYLDTEVKVGWIGMGGTPEAANPAPQRKGGGESLQDKISRRAPTLKQ